MNGVRGASEKNLTFRETFGCSHVFGLGVQPLWLLTLM
jgi:hypothetical protein